VHAVTLNDYSSEKDLSDRFKSFYESRAILLPSSMEGSTEDSSTHGVKISATRMDVKQEKEKEEQEETGDVLVVICDPIRCQQTLINHARHLASQQKALYAAMLIPFTPPHTIGQPQNPRVSHDDGHCSENDEKGEGLGDDVHGEGLRGEPSLDDADDKETEHEKQEKRVMSSSHAVHDPQQAVQQDQRRKKHIVFLVHLPPGVKNRTRHYSLDFDPDWTSVFVDDLRMHETDRSGREGSTVHMLQTSAYDLALGGHLDVQAIIRQRYQSALSMCLVSECLDDDRFLEHHSYFARIKLIRSLLMDGDSTFGSIMASGVIAVLKQHRNVDSAGR
jgi:hypothetical protein